MIDGEDTAALVHTSGTGMSGAMLTSNTLRIGASLICKARKITPADRLLLALRSFMRFNGLHCWLMVMSAVSFRWSALIIQPCVAHLDFQLDGVPAMGVRLLDTPSAEKAF